MTTNQDDSLWLTNSDYQFYSKYVCGGISMVFLVLFSIAVRNFRKHTLEVDMRDKLLLGVALL